MARNAQATQEREVIRIDSTRLETDDVVIGVNGKFYQIQRDTDVEVPHEVAVAYRMARENETKARQARRKMQRDVAKELEAQGYR